MINKKKLTGLALVVAGASTIIGGDGLERSGLTNEDSMPLRINGERYIVTTVTGEEFKEPIFKLNPLYAVFGATSLLIGAYTIGRETGRDDCLKARGYTRSGLKKMLGE